MKVLLFSGELMPFNGLPSSDGGLRAWQIYSGLRAHGVDVVASMPRMGAGVPEHLELIPEEERCLLWEEGRQQEIFRRVKPDLVLYTPHWEHREFFPLEGVPLVIDLTHPRYLGSEMVHSRERKVRVLSEADCLLVAGERQSFYFAGWLLQAGRIVEDESFIRAVPYSLSPELPSLRPFHAEEVPQLIQSPPFLSRSGEETTTVSALALSVSRWSIQRELLPPREIRHLMWCGCPVVCDPYFEGADLIKEYEAGWFVEPEDQRAISRLTKELLSNPDVVFERGRNAQRLIVENYTWERTIQPLLDFLRAPRKREVAQPVLGTSFLRPRTFRASGPAREVALSLGVTESFFSVPEANIGSIELPIRLGSNCFNGGKGERIEVSVCRPSGGVLVKKQVQLDSLPQSRVLQIPFSPLRSPKAGEVLCLRLKVGGESSAQSEGVGGRVFSEQLIAPEYPVHESGVPLAICLLPGQPTRWQRLLLSLGRATVMIRRGDTSRLFRAIVRRMPRGAQRFVEVLSRG